MRQLLSYVQFLKVLKLTDSRRSWTMWKIYTTGLTAEEAEKASYDKIWGYQPLGKIIEIEEFNN